MPRRAPTRLSEDLNMVAPKVADTSPDVPAAKRAKILSEDDGNEGEVGIAERVGGEKWAATPVGRVERGRFERPRGGERARRGRGEGRRHRRERHAR